MHSELAVFLDDVLVWRRDGSFVIVEIRNRYSYPHILKEEDVVGVWEKGMRRQMWLAVAAVGRMVRFEAGLWQYLSGGVVLEADDAADGNCRDGSCHW